MNIHEYDYSSRFHSLSKARISTARKLQGFYGEMIQFLDDFAQLYLQVLIEWLKLLKI